MGITVDELLQNPFTEMELDVQVRIVKEGKPRPALLLQKSSDEDSDILQRLFSDKNVYSQMKWLTGCEKRREVFCWPCLLFTPPNEWNTGISDLSYVLENMEYHEKEAVHLEAVFKLHIFIMKHTGKTHSVFEKIQHNNAVKRNRYFLKGVFYSICLATSERSQGDKLDDCHQLKIADCFKHYSDFLKNCDEEIEKVDFQFLFYEHPNLINDLVDAVTSVTRKAIANEAKKSSFVSMVLGEQVISDEKSQIYTVLRFIKDGKVHERFVGFTNEIERCRLYHRVEKHILSIMNDYEISDKLLSLSLDGALLARVEINDLLKSLESQCDIPFFVPCDFQGVGRVLMESLSHFEECNSFIQGYRNIERFFRVENHFRLFENRVRTKTTVVVRQYYENFPFIILLSNFRMHFIEFFTVCVQDLMFKDFLQDLNSIFLLKLLTKVFSDYFHENFTFRSDRQGIEQIGIAFGQFISHILKIRDQGFEKIWTDVVEDIDKGCRDSKESLKALNDHNKNDLFSLFQNVIDHLIKEVNFRSRDLPRLYFCDLLRYGESGRISLYEYLVLQLLKETGSFFDEQALNSEIKVLRADNPSIFTRKTIHQLLEVFVQYDLNYVFTQLYKLIELILTLPVFPSLPPKNKQIPKLNEIDRFSWIPEQTGIPTGDISLLCIENNLLQELRQSEYFLNDVIRQFYQLNKDIEIEMV